jgi:hypothetical protein
MKRTWWKIKTTALYKAWGNLFPAKWGNAITSCFINAQENYLFHLYLISTIHRGSNVFAFDTLRQLQTKFGRSGSYKGATSWYHDLTIDKEGNIYMGDILGNTIQKFKKISD